MAQHSTLGGYASSPSIEMLLKTKIYNFKNDMKQKCNLVTHIEASFS